ncbi:MAG: hypothetical protein QW803_09730 [Candidatus Methanomethylicia archaeon]
MEGVLYLKVNDTRGLWSFSKAMRGVLPHGWDRYLNINQIEFRKNIEAEEGFIFLDVKAKRSLNFGFYNEGWINLFVSFWFMLDNDTFNDPNSTQLVVDVRLFGLQYRSGNVRYVIEDIAFQGHSLGIDNDHHYITSDNQFFLSEANQYYEVQLDLGKLFKKALSYCGRDSARLMEIEIVLEANYGYAEAEIDYIKIYTDPKPNSSYVLVNSTMIFLMAFISLAFIAILRVRR